jgi:hypothetical protein
MPDSSGVTQTTNSDRLVWESSWLQMFVLMAGKVDAFFGASRISCTWDRWKMDPKKRLERKSDTWIALFKGYRSQSYISWLNRGVPVDLCTERPD